MYFLSTPGPVIIVYESNRKIYLTYRSWRETVVLETAQRYHYQYLVQCICVS